MLRETEASKLRFANMQDAIRRRTITRTAVPDEELVVVMKSIGVDGHEWEYEQILEDADYDPSTNDVERSDDRERQQDSYNAHRSTSKLQYDVTSQTNLQRSRATTTQKERLDSTCPRLKT